MPLIAGMSGSVRAESLNSKLIGAALERAANAGADIDSIDLGAHPLPLYDGDDERAHGFPAGAAILRDRLGRADGVFIGCPEYNGGPTGMLKNTIDWVTRVDMRAFQGFRIGLLGASPGGRGAIGSLALTTMIFEHMRCTVHESFSLPKANDAFTENELEPDTSKRLDEWVASFLVELSASEA